MINQYFYHEKIFSVILPYVQNKVIATNNPHIAHTFFLELPDKTTPYDVFIGVPRLHTVKSAKIFFANDSVNLFHAGHASNRPFALLVNTTVLAHFYYHLDKRRKPFCVFFNTGIETDLTTKAFVWYTYGITKQGYRVVDWRSL